MLSRINSVVWMEGKKDEETASWNNNNNGGLENKDEMGSLSAFKSMLEAGEEEEEEWYLAASDNITFFPNFTEADNNNLPLQQVDSSSSCSPSSASIFNNLDPSQVNYFLPQKPTNPLLLNPLSNNPLENSFDLSCETGFLENQALNSLGRGNGIMSEFSNLSSQTHMDTCNLSSDPHFSTTHLLQLAGNSGAISAGFDSTGFQGFEPRNGNSLFFDRSKLLKPLENSASGGAQPNLFQKTAALRKNLADSVCNLGLLGNVGGFDRWEVGEESEKKRKNSYGDDLDNLSFDASGLNYDSDEFMENNKVEDSGKNGGDSSNANSAVTEGIRKGRKKGSQLKI